MDPVNSKITDFSEKLKEKGYHLNLELSSALNFYVIEKDGLCILISKIDLDYMMNNVLIHIVETHFLANERGW